MLTPADLGTTWSAVEAPPISTRTPPPLAVGPTAVYEVRANLQTQHWTGSTWMQDQNILEIATSYGTPAKASKELYLQALQGRGDCGQCALSYHPVKIAGTKVWQFTSKETTGSSQTLLAVGPLFVRITITTPAPTESGVVSAEEATRVALQRLKAEPEPQ